MASKKYPDKMLKQLRESSKPKTSVIPNQGLVESDEKLKYTLMQLDNKNVVMSNVIVLGSQPTSLIEAKLLRILLSQTKSLEFQNIEDIIKNPPVFYIEVKELAKMFYTNDTSNIYRDIQSAAVSLTKRNIFFKTRESDEWISYPWTSFVKYGSGILEVKINPDLYPYLVNMKGNFSKFSLDVLLSFKSKYSMRLYEGLQAKIYRDTVTRELFKQGREVTVSFDIDELRVITSTVLIYGKIYNLKKRCIEPAVAEISEKTTMNVLGYEVGRRGSADKNTILFFVKNKETASFMDDESEAYAPLKVYRLDDNANLDSGYIEEVFNNYDVTESEGSGEIRELLALYGDKTEDFNLDFQKMIETGQNTAPSMKKMIARKRQDEDVQEQMTVVSKHTESLKSNKSKTKKKPVLQRQDRGAKNARFDEMEFAEFEDIAVQTDSDPLEALIEEGELNLTYITKLFNAAEWRYTFEDIGRIITLYRTDSQRFNTDFRKARKYADHNPVRYMIKIGENAQNQRPSAVQSNRGSSRSNQGWLTAEFEALYQDILDYWDGVCLKMKAEDAMTGGDGQATLKPIRRTDLRHKRFVHQLLEEGETVESIQEAIETASTSAFFIRTQGSFNFFINPKNYYDIAAGERDYDAEQANLWRMGRG